MHHLDFVEPERGYSEDMFLIIYNPRLNSCSLKALSEFGGEHAGLQDHLSLSISSFL